LPWVAYIHGWTNENMKVELYNWVDRTIVRFADRIIPVSRDLGKRLQLRSYTGQKMVVIHNAADPAGAYRSGIDVRSSLKVARDEVLVGVVGRLSPEKGHRYFLEAIQLISRDFPIKAVFIGDGQERDNLNAEIRKGALSERVMLAGFQADVSPFYQACDIIALPSLTEGLPNAALEAMAFGRPVVASDVGGIPEVVVDGETGLLVPSCNPEALAAALVRLAGDRSQMRQFGMAGKQRVEQDFNPQERVKKVADIYRQVLHA
jgi:glycosyltransferase involved in cell wall biosynthesis